MLSRRIYYQTALLLIAAVITGCQSQSQKDAAQEGEGQSGPQTIRVGVLPTLDCMPMYLADELHLFETQQVDVSLVRCNAHLDCDEMLTKKTIDGAISDLIRAERLKAKGVALEYPISTDTYWQLITNRLARVNELKQLGDKMLAITRYSATDYLGNLAVDSAKPQNTVFRVQVNDVNVRLKMLQTNAMDAMMLTEPQATEARLGKHPVLMDSRDKGVRLGVFAFRTDALSKARRSGAYKGFVNAYNQACDSLNAYGLAHYADIVKRCCHIDDKVLMALPKVKYEHAAPPREKDLLTAKNVKWKE